MVYGTELFSQESLILARDVSFYLIFAPFVISLIRLRELKGIQRLIFALVVLGLLTEVLTRLILNMSQNNLWIYHIYVPIAFYVTIRLYGHRTVKVLKAKQMIWLVCVFVFLAVINAIFFQNVNEFNSYMISIGSFVYIGLSILFFYRLLKNGTNHSVVNRAAIWFNIGVLLYFSATFTLFVVVNKIIAGKSVVDQSEVLMSPSGNGRKSLAFRRRLQFEAIAMFSGYTES